MAKKILFIFNPNSGKGKIKNSLYDIIECFTRADYDVTVYPTQKSGDCEEKIKNDAPMYDIAVISGGDGTLSEAVSGMISLSESRRIPIGYIPAGTTNDFASTNNIPPYPEDAAQEIIDGKYVPYDIGILDDKCFIYVAAFGAFTDVSYETPQIYKNILGPAAYFLEGIKSLPKIKGINTKIITDTGEEIDASAALVLIMNSTSVAGIGFGEFYDIDTSDGIFEIVVVPKSIKILDFHAIINGIKNGERNIGDISVLSVKEATIKTEEPVKWTLDGEYGGETDCVKFKVCHKAVEFFMSNNR